MVLKMILLKKTKQQNRNPFFDNKKTNSDLVGFARPRKGRSSKKDKHKSKCEREFNF